MQARKVIECLTELNRQLTWELRRLRENCVLEISDVNESTIGNLTRGLQVTLWQRNSLPFTHTLRLQVELNLKVMD
jgi:hypothetical protein